MYPLDSPARHRRQPSTKQRIRGAVVLLGLLAVIAGFGVFGGTLLGGHFGQARILEEIPFSLRLAGWAMYAVPVAGACCLILPTQSRLVRSLAFLLLVPGVVAAVAMSRPRGMTTAEWKAALDAPAFVDAAQATTLTLAAVVVVWAVALAVMLATTARFDDLVARARRSSIWFGPLALTASFAAVFAL